MGVAVRSVGDHVMPGKQVGYLVLGTGQLHHRIS